MFAVVLDVTDFFIIGLVVIVAASSLSVYLKPKERSRLSRIDAKLDLLLKHAGLTFDPKAGVPAGVMEALERGNKIEAIKLYREATGVGLAEAKVFVEGLPASPKA